MIMHKYEFDVSIIIIVVMVASGWEPGYLCPITPSHEAFLYIVRTLWTGEMFHGGFNRLDRFSDSVNSSHGSQRKWDFNFNWSSDASIESCWSDLSISDSLDSVGLFGSLVTMIIGALNNVKGFAYDQ
jgi:hypothetical protein